MGLIDTLRSWFPSVKDHRSQADKLQRDVAALKTLTFNGDLDWFIDQCREHRKEVCNDDTDNAA